MNRTRKTPAPAPSEPPVPLDPVDPVATWEAATRTPGHALHFVPVAMRARKDGWTAARQRMFVVMLVLTGDARHAAAHVGKTVQTAMRLRHRPGGEGFSHACAAAYGLFKARRKPGRDRGRIPGPAPASMAATPAAASAAPSPPKLSLAAIRRRLPIPEGSSRKGSSPKGSSGEGEMRGDVSSLSRTCELFARPRRPRPAPPHKSEAKQYRTPRPDPAISLPSSAPTQ